MQNRLIVQNVLAGLYIKINLDHYYYLANNSLHFELTVALSRTRLSASDNKESMEGPGAQSNNKQQFNDCHDGSPGTGQMKGQPPMSRPRQPPHSTAALWSGSRLRGLILFLFVFDLWLIRWLLASSRPARLCLNTDTGIKTQMWAWVMAGLSCYLIRGLGPLRCIVNQNISCQYSSVQTHYISIGINTVWRKSNR